MKKKILLLSMLTLLCTAGCISDDDIPVVRGCTDPKSLSYNFNATESDGNCAYSTAVFYASTGIAFGNIPIMHIELSIDGNFTGIINTVYPTGPGNCSAPGTLSYQFENGSSVDWNTIVHLANGQMIFDSGVASPNSLSQCIRVNVTN